MWLSREVIERFIAVGCPNVRESTRGNYRTRLLRLSEIVLGGACRTGKPAKLSASVPNSPYTRTELADLWGWASGQATEELRWGCKTLMALGLGVALDKPGQRPAYNGLKILNRLQERGYEPGYLAGDRAYNNSEPTEWQIPVRAMGYKPVYDYRGDQLGNQGGTEGAILVEGRWYCPSMPEPLINATIDLYAERIDRETWVRLIAARRGYRLMPKQNTDADGYQRMMCPAEAGKAQCLIKPHTLGRGIHLPLVDPEPSPAGTVNVCRQKAINVSPEAGAKPWKALEYGGPEWQKVYFRLRNSVEGYNGYAKNPLAEGIEAAGSRRIRGIAAQTILLAFQLAHANRRKIKKWLETLTLGGERPRRRTHHRRPTREPRSWTPTGHLTPAA